MGVHFKLSAGILACTILLGVQVAHAGIEEVKKAFDEVAGDPARLAVYCEMSAYIASPTDDIDDAKVEAYLAKLGPIFSAAWNAGDEFTASDDESRKYDAALDALIAKCKT